MRQYGYVWSKVPVSRDQSGPLSWNWRGSGQSTRRAGWRRGGVMLWVSWHEGRIGRSSKPTTSKCQGQAAWWGSRVGLPGWGDFSHMEMPTPCGG
eukprot:766254-Hanusia_phi.AAC.2